MHIVQLKCYSKPHTHTDIWFERFFMLSYIYAQFFVFGLAVADTAAATAAVTDVFFFLFFLPKNFLMHKICALQNWLERLIQCLRWYIFVMVVNNFWSRICKQAN